MVQPYAIQFAFHFLHAMPTSLELLPWLFCLLKYLKDTLLPLCWRFQRSEVFILYCIAFDNFLLEFLFIPLIIYLIISSVKYNFIVTRTLLLITEYLILTFDSSRLT